MSAKLLDPKINYVYRRFLTEKQMLGLLKKFKQKKYGMKIYAVDVEEVQDKVKNSVSYFHLRVEYITE